MNLTKDDRGKIIAWAKKHPTIKSVYLFGSRARGDNRPYSDIDLAIKMTGNDSVEAQMKYMDLGGEIDTLNLSHKVNPEWWDKDVEPPSLDTVGPAVKKDGILLYPELAV